MIVDMTKAILSVELQNSTVSLIACYRLCWVEALLLLQCTLLYVWHVSSCRAVWRKGMAAQAVLDVQCAVQVCLFAAPVCCTTMH
jgi:hypothetical protein